MRNFLAIIFIALFPLSVQDIAYSQNNQVSLSAVEEFWINGDIEECLIESKRLLQIDSNSNDALYYYVMSLFLKGKYEQALIEFSKIDSTYEKHQNLLKHLATIYEHHYIDMDKAYEIYDHLNDPRKEYLKLRLEKPFTCKADKTYVIPFYLDIKYAENLPAVIGKINGQETPIRFDTGGPYIVMGLKEAEKFGIKVIPSGYGMHGRQKVKSWRGILETLEIGEGLIFKNVPIVVLETLAMSVFGTNILEQFLATIDYPNKRMIFTPRNAKHLYENHFNLIGSDNIVKMPFYLWHGHHMFAKGSFEHDNKRYEKLNWFFDSGLVALYDLNFGDGVKRFQAPFTCSGESLIQLGYTEDDVKQAPLIDDYTLEIGGSLKQTHKVMHRSGKMDKINYWSGIRIDGLISHAFLSKYSWTIDFDSFEYTFGINE